MFHDMNFEFKYLNLPIKFMDFMEYDSFLNSNNHVMASATTFWLNKAISTFMESY
jgi:hypothetical protein